MAAIAVMQHAKRMPMSNDTPLAISNRVTVIPDQFEQQLYAVASATKMMQCNDNDRYGM